MKSIKGVYKELENYIQRNGYITFKDPVGKILGKREGQVLFVRDEIDILSKRNMANKIVMELTTKGCVEKLYEIIDIYFVLVDKINIYLKEGLLDEKVLNEYAIDLCMQSRNPKEIKLGLTILRVCKPREEILNMLKVLSISNEYLFYVLDVYRNYDNSNKLVFEVAKISTGLGRLFVMERIEAINEEIKTWLVEEGANNNLFQSTLAEIVIKSNNLTWYISKYRMNKSRFRIITNLLFKIYEESTEYIELNNYCDSNKFKKYFLKYGCELEEVYILIKGIEDDINDYVENKDYWTSKIKEEFLKDKYSIYILVELAETLYIDIELDDMRVTLDRNRLNAKLYKYIIENITLNEIGEFINITKNYISDKVTNIEERLFYEDDVSEEIIEDVCFYMIVYSMYIAEIDDKELLLKALGCRYIPTVLIGIKILKSKKVKFTREEVAMLKNISSKQKDGKVKRSILRLIDNKDKKELRTLSINDVKTTPHLKDVKLKNVKVAGCEYRDIPFISDLLEVNTIVYLKREKDNIYDKRAILVLTKEGYNIGYIPKSENEIFSNLLDKDRYLYGIITSIDDEYKEIRVDIHLSYRYVLKEINMVVNMVTKSKGNYLN